MPLAPDPLSPAAREVIHPAMTPCQQAQALNQKHLSVDAVKALAYGMPDHKAVLWAIASAGKVSNPAHIPDLRAIEAAKVWGANPTPANQEAAAMAAAKTDFKTPGAWAAQAAAWVGLSGGLAAHAVVGSVLLAAAQGGKPISPPGAPPVPTVPGAPPLPVTAVTLPQAPRVPLFGLPFFKKPVPPPLPEAPKLGPDGLSLTAAQRVEMAKNCDPFLKLGCEVGHGKSV